MRRNVELYIKAGLDTDEVTYQYERIELFDFEEINITNKIQDIKDISKVFTDYSQQFTIPASSNNNKIFKHYYNFDILNGFDARIKLDALIKINGINYREGRMTLSGSSLKNNIAYSYSVIFYGKTVSLNELMGDDKLELLGTSSIYNNLDPYLDRFTFSYTAQVVEDGLNKGFNLVNDVLDVNSDAGAESSGDLCFPFISASSFYFYDTNDGLNPKDRVESRNVRNITTNPRTPRGIYYKDLKPAIRIYHIIKAIETKYGIQFTDDFFNTTNEPFYELYLLLHREKGDITGQTNIQSANVNLNAFTYEGFTCVVPTTNCGGEDLRNNGDLSKITVPRYFIGEVENTTTAKYTITVGAGEEYTLFLKDSITGDLIDTPENGISKTGSSSQTFRLNHTTGSQSKTIQPVLTIETQGSVTSYDIDLELQETKETEYGVISSFKSNYTELTSQTLGGGFNIASQMPKMKTIDFLTSIFKTFNLTAYYIPESFGDSSAGKIRVRTLDDYYNTGNVVDLTKYVDNSKIDVNRDNLYSTIDFEFQKPSTFAIINSNQLTYDEFGNERLNNTSQDIESPLAFDGGKYSVKLGFDKVQYERMTNQANEVIAPIQWGWLVNKDENEVLTKPLIFYPIKQGSGVPLLFDDGISPSPLPNANYIRPSNALEGVSESINFGSEFDEWEAHEDSAITNENSLFNGYYKNYVLRIYDVQSRKVNLKANLPAGIITTIEPNDCILIKNKYFNINSIKLNLSTGNCDLELINNATSIAAGNLVLDRPTLGRLAATTNSLTIRVLENLSVDNLIHDIYVDNILTLSNQTSREINITSLSSGTSYNIRAVSKIQGTSIESVTSQTYIMTTIQAP